VDVTSDGLFVQCVVLWMLRQMAYLCTVLFFGCYVRWLICYYTKYCLYLYYKLLSIKIRRHICSSGRNCLNSFMVVSRSQLSRVMSYKYTFTDFYKHFAVKVKVKVKFTLEQATKAQRGSRSIILLFL